MPSIIELGRTQFTIYSAITEAQKVANACTKSEEDGATYKVRARIDNRYVIEVYDNTGTYVLNL